MKITMKTRLARAAGPAAAVAVLGVSAATAQDYEISGQQRATEYRIVELNDLGGPINGANGINDDRLLTGFAELPGGNNRHAQLWLHGFNFDLGTLGGPNSNVPWPVKNRIGLIAGIAQHETPEPLGQQWSCRSFFSFNTRRGFICSAVVWENGKIRELPTLGGVNGFATAANNHRQVVGWAQNTTLDSSCNTTFVKQQFRALIWGPGEDQKKELLPLQGDTTTAATAINDSGQVVGISGNCGTAVGGTSAREAVMWHKNKTTIIGNLGGVAWNTPMALNERGDVVGFSNISAASGATPNWHAFYWNKHTGIKDLGALDGYPLSQALGINEKRQIVGTSCTADFNACRAWIYENGRMTDLNERLPAGYTDLLYAAGDINNDGEIAAQAQTPGTEEYTALWMIPQGRSRGHASDAADSPSATARAKQIVPLPKVVRQAMLQRYGLNEHGQPGE